MMTKKTTSLNEAIAVNDIPWGDSLIGRLINSTIRKAKIGYNQTKVPALLDAFKRELDTLIASGLQKEAKDTFTLIMIQSMFSELQNICTSSKTDDEKMNILVGDNSNLWDSSDPNGGMWKDNVSTGYLRQIYEELDYNFDEEQIKKVNLDKKNMLDNISILIDNLRRLTSTTPATNAQQAGYGSFSSNFGNVTNTFSKLVIASAKYDFGDQKLNESVSSFKRFVEEFTIEQDKEYTYKNDGKNSKVKVKSLETSYEIGPDKKWFTNDDKQGQKIDQKQAFVVFKDDKGNSTNAGIVDRDKLNLIQSKTSQQKDEFGTNPKDRVSKFKELSTKAKDQQIDPEKPLENPDIKNFIKCLLSLTDDDINYMTEKNPNSKLKIGEKELNLVDGIQELLKDPIFDKLKDQLKITGVRGKDSNEDIFKSSKYTKDQKIEAFKKRLQRKGIKEDRIKQIKDYLTKLGINENKQLVLDFEFHRIFESVADGSVENCFNAFKESLTPELFEITQRQVDKVVKLGSQDSSQLLIDLRKHPDPIIRMVRIFKRAHDLYFTPVIPSGRSDGRVSNKTYREYIKLGGAESRVNDQTGPGYGPWAVKKIYDKFRDGILEIIEDQKYRNILANAKFVVPGAEDTFNQKKESKVFSMTEFKKIFEVDSSDTNKSQGQILFDFIQDMLDQDTSAEFDKSRRTLLKKYFGAFGVEEQILKSTDPSKTPQAPTPQPNARDREPNNLIWIPANKFTCLDETSNRFKGGIYAIPITKNGAKEIIFAHVLRKIKIDSKDRYIIKFVINSQKTLVGKYNDNQHRFRDVAIMDYSISTGNKVYYGIINKFPKNNEKIKMVYSNIMSSNSRGAVEEEEFMIENKKSGTGLDIVVSELKYTDASTPPKIIQIDTEFSEKLSSESSDHSTNLSINGLLQELENKAETYFK